jgi:hypothetical protein
VIGRSPRRAEPNTNRDATRKPMKQRIARRLVPAGVLAGALVQPVAIGQG